ncbi:T9SS type A sorting domain-containing protein [Kaistella yonginensis]|uniref:T9SS type A sorting domain-containing protein n=1 Tax=Kaistella yonginensis TaxID=658267 RepID=UPI0025B3E8CB|nr:T9SS type A sorting domain-containing protein [Kaistella yonginensis]MDN3606371.1 T9SS type A sorting domain-containing protein [Kaistella yonginensis]
MKKFYIGVFFLFGISHLQAQETKTLWQKDIKSSTQDFLSGMTATIDRQILLSGSSINQKSQQISTDNKQPNRGYDYHVVKLDQQGNKAWDKCFGGTRHDYLMSSIATKEGGFLLAGTSFSNQSGDKKENNLGGSDVWIIRLDENGEELWQKTWGTKSNDEASSVVQSVDEGFFVAGNINSNKQLFGSKDVFVSKFDKEGQLINTTILGGKRLDEVQEIIPAKDGGVVVLIYSTSGKTENIIAFNDDENKPSQESANNQNNPQKENRNQGINILDSDVLLNHKNGQPTTINYQSKTEDGFGAGDYWVVKLDKNANVEWQKTYGGNDDDRPKTIAFAENGYIISGESRSNSSGNKRENIKEGTDLWIINIDELGNEIWQKNYSFGNRDVAMSLDVIRRTTKNNQSEDKGFLIGGYTQAEEKIQTDDEKFWMIYLDTNGKEEWRKHVEGKSKKKEERLVSAKLQNDGTFLLAGTSAEELGQENWKILKLGDKDLDHLIEKQDIRIYPNPVEDYSYVEIGFPLQYNEEAEIFLHDMSGRQVQSIKTKNRVTKINTSALPQGVYVVSANTKTKVVNAKIVKK